MLTTTARVDRYVGGPDEAGQRGKDELSDRIEKARYEVASRKKR
jgi:hypothetical protein